MCVLLGDSLIIKFYFDVELNFFFFSLQVTSGLLQASLNFAGRVVAACCGVKQVEDFINS